MATLQELEAAIIGAHKAGDTRAAEKLAAEIIKMKGVPGGPAPAPVGPRAEYDALPEHMKAFTAFNDVLRLASNAVTLGNRDRFAQYLGGRSPQEEMAITDAAKERAGTAGIAAQMLPALAAPAIPAAASIALGAPMGAAYADARGGGPEEMVEGAAEGLLSATGGQLAGKAIGDLVGLGSRMFRGKPKRMTSTALAREKELLNWEIENSGVRYRPGTVTDMLKAIDKASEKRIPGVHRKATSVTKHLQKTYEGKGASLYDVDQIQHMINRDVTKSSDAGDAEFGRRMSDAVDQTLSDVEPKGILMSKNPNPAYGYELMDKAREMSKRSRKIDELEFKGNVAERRAEGLPHLTETQAKQNQIASILDNPSLRGGFTKDEIAKMETVARGSTKVKVLKKASDLLVPGGGSPAPWIIAGGAGTGAGYMTGGNALAAGAGFGLPIAIGLGAQKWANKATDKQFEELLDLVAAGGKNAPDLSQFPKALRQKIAQAIAMGGLLAD